MKTPTLKQKLTFKQVLEHIESETPFTLEKAMVKSGYKKTTAHNPQKNLLSKDGWQQLLAQIDDSVILARFWQILLSKDSRASLEAGDKLLKLKDKYPDKKIRLGALDERAEVFD